MENIVKKYNEYKESIFETWKKRLTWQGLNGKEPKHTTSIIRFNEETNAFSSLNEINTTNKFFEAVAKLAEDYVQWVKTKEHFYNEKEYEDMRNFFVGALGELFFFYILTDTKNLLVQKNNNIYDMVYFSQVSPTLSKDKDYGVDFTTITNNIGCVLQVKFWNPFDSKTKIDIVTTVQKAYAEGVAYNFIDPKENNTVILCCLFDETTLYEKFDVNCVWKNKVVIIGKNCLDKNINGETKIMFWKNFVKVLANMNTTTFCQL